MMERSSPYHVSISPMHDDFIIDMFVYIVLDPGTYTQTYSINIRNLVPVVSVVPAAADVRVYIYITIYLYADAIASFGQFCVPNIIIIIIYHHYYEYSYIHLLFKHLIRIAQRHTAYIKMILIYKFIIIRVFY